MRFSGQVYIIFQALLKGETSLINCDQRLIITATQASNSGITSQG